MDPEDYYAAEAEAHYYHEAQRWYDEQEAAYYRQAELQSKAHRWLTRLVKPSGGKGAW